MQRKLFGYWAIQRQTGMRKCDVVHTRLLNVLSHTFWFLPNVASCYAMYNLLQQKQNSFYHDYRINVCAGTKAGIGVDALEPVQKSMGDPLTTKTITLSCGKLTTGVTVKPWTGIFMLRNLKSPETYFQAAFRVQSPWTVRTGSGTDQIIQEKLIKFATRVPIFMYLTDYRERSLKDVITQLEPGLFKKVTGLDVKDFNLLVELNVFNASLMNDAIFKFKRYEDSSLSYTGLDKHENEDVGGWDTVVKRKEYELLFYNQQSTMNAPEINEADVPEADEEPEPPKAPVPTRTPPAKPDFVTAAFGVKSPIVPAKPQQPEKPKADVSGVSVGSAVAHAKFGIGKVIELNRGYVTVRFEQGEKRFIFPDAFESGFLKAQ